MHLCTYDLKSWCLYSLSLTSVIIHSDHERLQRVNGAPIGRISDHFTGREEELVLLQTIFDKGKSSKGKSSRPNCYVIYGMPGIGKSQLSLRYAKISFDLGHYSHIFWTSAASVDKLIQGFAEILNLVGHRDRYLPDQAAKVTAARLWLEEPHGDDVDWLLVFDNVDESTLDFLRTHLPQKNARGNILFTTRTKKLAETLVTAAGHRDRTRKLEALGLRDSANLLFKDAGIDKDSVEPSLLSHAEALVQCVGRLPLAVVQAASFMRETQTSLDDMLELYKSDEKIEVGPCSCCMACVVSN
jgi:hypothetical protein